MDVLIVYPDGTDKPGVEFKCADGFVSRVVGAVAETNIPDAERVCQILNADSSADASGERVKAAEALLRDASDMVHEYSMRTQVSATATECEGLALRLDAFLNLTRSHP